MNIVVFGANGRTGILIVKQALNEGHNVIAFVRNKTLIDFANDKLTIIEGDVMNYCKVESVIEGSDAVILALGNNKEKDDNTLEVGTKNILHGMEEKNVKRLICISASGVLGNDRGFLYDNIILPLFFRKDFEHKKQQLRLIIRSNLNWTIIRPPKLTDEPKNGSYHISFDKPYKHKLSRTNLAEFILKQLNNNEYIRRMPIISN